MSTALVVAVLSAGLALGSPASARAGQAAAAPSAGPPTASQPPSPASEGKLPVSLDRIRRQLRQQASSETERFENFRLITSLNVYGQAPRFELYSPDDPNSPVRTVGPVRYGGMTHSEFLSQVTPDNFQAPVMNLSGAVFSLGNWIADRKRESQRRKETEARQGK